VTLISKGNLKADFILASASPRRRELLNGLGLKFDVIPADVDESYLNGETPVEHVVRLSKMKADKICSQYPKSWVLSADTVVVLGGKILTKPADKSEARMMLDFLSGKVHEVYTGYSLKNLGAGKGVSDYVISKVKIKALTAEEKEFYVNTNEPYDKAGGYAVQGIGAFMVEEVNGSYTNVVGLPLCQVLDKLESLGGIKLF